MERADGASNNAVKHRKTNSPVQSWRPVSTEASPGKGVEAAPSAAATDLIANSGSERKERYIVPARRQDVNAVVHTNEEGNLDCDAADLDVISNSGSKQVVETPIINSENLAYNATLLENNPTFVSGATKLVINYTMEVIGENIPLLLSLQLLFIDSGVILQVDSSLMRFLKGKGGSMQKQIEQETGVEIIFPSSKEETVVVLKGKSAESITKASERITKVLEEAVKSPMLDYSHFISLPLAIHPDLVEKLNNFRRPILGVSASDVDSDKDESRSEDSADENDQAGRPGVWTKRRVEEEKSVDNKNSQPEFSIDKSIFIKPKTFHLTVLMLKLWNKDRIAKASDVLQSISSQVNEALENRPISIQLRGLTCMKGSPARARVVYAPVLEVGGEGRLVCACKVITEAFVKSGLVLERDARQELKILHTCKLYPRARESSYRNVVLQFANGYNDESLGL